MTAGAGMFWRQAAARGGFVLLVAAGLLTVWYRTTYHVWPGLGGVPAVVHWCGRDYQAGLSGPQTWAQVTAQAPVAVEAVGSYPPFGPGRPLLADTGNVTNRPAGQVCAMIVYLRTSPGRYQAYTLEGGP